MQIFDFLLSQLLHYGLAWLVFAGISYCVARFAPWWCIPIGYIAVAFAVYWLDATRVQAEMRKPDWNGTPDLDMIFMLGVLIRIFVISLLLTPLSILGIVLRRQHRLKTK